MPELMRRQYLVTPDNVSKLRAISRAEGVSATEIVRRAIDAYQPDMAETTGESELLDLVAARLKEAIASTKRANRKVSRTLRLLTRDGD
jgi:hypothetical protein